MPCYPVFTTYCLRVGDTTSFEIFKVCVNYFMLAVDDTTPIKLLISCFISHASAWTSYNGIVFPMFCFYHV